MTYNALLGRWWWKWWDLVLTQSRVYHLGSLCVFAFDDLAPALLEPIWKGKERKALYGCACLRGQQSSSASGKLMREPSGAARNAYRAPVLRTCVQEFLRLWFRERCDPYKDATLPEAPKELVMELSKRWVHRLFCDVHQERDLNTDARCPRWQGSQFFVESAIGSVLECKLLTTHT
eukprot:1157755-Pelagomonas_calceolata.AAC.1